ncbi:hypothetical protein [Croceicoccus bisphenolivorans]|uniref:hypothetical protein n=1 Tax=Croceicoccus bisphenolivorans TaxID=1783232 RepID=UPI000A703A5B|nr:hypothetical protein [Croceicoccus bisphenolivorans]
MNMASMDERRQVRQVIHTQGNFRRGVGIGLKVEVANLTQHGCCLCSIPGNLRRGDYLSLRLAGFGPIEGEIKWLHLGKAAGMQFYTPLHQAVFDHIVARHRVVRARPDQPSSHIVQLRDELDRLQN